AALLAIALAWRGPPQVVERIRIVEVERAAPAGQVVRAEPTAPVEPDRASAATNEAPRRPAVERNAAPSAIAWSAEPRRFAATRGAIIPPAGMEFRLFEHLIAESTWRHSAAPAATDESSPDVLSPRSLPHW